MTEIVKEISDTTRLIVPKATKNSGLISIIAGTLGFLGWHFWGPSQYLMPVVFGCLVSVIAFFVVNLIEWKRGVPPAPSAYHTPEEEAAQLAKEQEQM